MTQLTFERLHDAVAGDSVALRSRATLQPAGGVGDKVFPPSYAVDGRAEHKYAVEERQVGESDRVSTTVLLDSVASQANRAELALLEGWEIGRAGLPRALRGLLGRRGRDRLREADGARGASPARRRHLPG